jgi:hypothetical protein
MSEHYYVGTFVQSVQLTVVGVHPNGDMEMVGLYTDAHCRSCGIEPAAGDARMCGECSAFQRYGLGGGWVPA